MYYHWFIIYHLSCIIVVTLVANWNLLCQAAGFRTSDLKDHRYRALSNLHWIAQTSTVVAARCIFLPVSALCSRWPMVLLKLDQCAGAPGRDNWEKTLRPSLSNELTYLKSIFSKHPHWWSIKYSCYHDDFRFGPPRPPKSNKSHKRSDDLWRSRDTIWSTHPAWLRPRSPRGTPHGPQAPEALAKRLDALTFHDFYDTNVSAKNYTGIDPR